MVEKRDGIRRRTVVIADDNPKILAMAARMLDPAYDVIAQVADGEALVTAVAELRPDAAVVDIDMPRLNGIEATRRLMQQSKPAVVYLTGQADPGLIQEAFAAGGFGFVLKASASEDLIPAIDAALNGKTFLSPSLK